MIPARRLTIMRHQLAEAVRLGGAAELILESRLAASCRTPGCKREVQRDAAHCPSCLSIVWTTAAEPERVAS